MAAISASMVKDLRDKTGAGMMDCKAALKETDGDVEAAVDWLRKKGLSKAAKKAGRAAAEGLVAYSVEGTKGSIVEVNAETDFVGPERDVPDDGAAPSLTSPSSSRPTRTASSPRPSPARTRPWTST